MSYLFVILGFVLMVGGAEYFVKGAVRIASNFGIPPLLIGLTIVAWGTSLPELAVSLGAAGKDAAGLALGNVIGSNIANVLLIGGIGALLLPLCCKPGDLRRDAILLAVASLLVAALGMFGYLSVWMGCILLGLLLAQTFTIYRGVQQGRDEGVEIPDESDTSMPLWKAVAFFLAGLAGVIVGSEVLVRAALVIAEIWAVPDAVIGVTLVAVGTSLPELATVIAAARQGQRDVIVGNIVGSNIANIVLVLGVVSIVAPGAIPAALLDGDGLVMVVSSALFLGIILLGAKIGRLWGLAFLAAYALYIAWQFDFFDLI